MASTLTELWDLEDRFTASVGSVIGAVAFSAGLPTPQQASEAHERMSSGIGNSKRGSGSHVVASSRKRKMLVRLKEKVSIERAGDRSIDQKTEHVSSMPSNLVIQCFACNAKQEVSSAATSTFCPNCSTHIDLRDYKITSAFSRSIRTQGGIHVTPKGELSSTTVTCRSALIEGKVRGNMNCLGTATINFVGKIPGRLIADNIVIDRKSNVHFFRQVRVKTIEIRGRMTGEIVAEGAVVIHRNGELDGTVIAKSISVEKGGVFSATLIQISGEQIETAQSHEAALGNLREQKSAGVAPTPR